MLIFFSGDNLYYINFILMSINLCLYWTCVYYWGEELPHRVAGTGSRARLSVALGQEHLLAASPAGHRGSRRPAGLLPVTGVA